jgi:hypothetical protein
MLNKKNLKELIYSVLKDRVAYADFTKMVQEYY